MKKGIYLILFLIVSLNQYSQGIIDVKSEKHTVKCSKERKNIYSIDSLSYYISKYSFRKKEYYLYRDSIITDTLKMHGNIIFDDYTKKYYFMETYRNYGHLFTFEPNTGKVGLSVSDKKLSVSSIYNNKIPKIDSVRLKTSIPILDGYNQLQGYKEIEINFAFQLSILDIQENRKELLVDFSENIKENFISEIINFSLFKDKVIFYTGYLEAGGIYNGQYWAINIKNKKLNKINIPKDYIETHFYLDTKKEHLIILKETFNTIDAIVFDNNLQNIGKLLYRQNTVKGFKINNGVKNNNYYNSYLDDETCIFLLDNIEVERELAMYNVYIDDILQKKDIINLNTWDLQILKNMIFAKHNYKFASEYYQAYFNLYRFYNAPQKRKTRTKKINHLLTEADKVNLKLIKKIIKSIE